MTDRNWMLVGGTIGLLGFPVGIALIAGSKGHPILGALLIPLGITVLIRSQMFAFRIYARHKRPSKPGLLDVTGRRLLFRGELGAQSPLWTESGVGLDLSLFSLRPKLKGRLVEWVQGGLDLDDDEYTRWLSEGRQLCKEAKAALAGTVEVVWDQNE